MKLSLQRSMIVGTLTLWVMVTMLSCTGKPDYEGMVAERQSELYVRQFKAMFDSMPADRRAQLAGSVRKHSVRLDALLDSAAHYKEEKRRRIADIKNRPVTSDTGLLAKYIDLYREYIVSSFDSSFVYAHKIREIASRMSDPDIKARAAILLSNLYIQGGYFREADQAIYGFDEGACSDSMKIRVGIARFNLEYENCFFFAWRLYRPNVARQNMLRIYDELFPLLPDDSYEIYYMKMLMAFSNREFKQSENYGNILLTKTEKGSPEYIKTIADIGFSKMGYGEFADAMRYMIEEAQYGIRSGSSNYFSLRKIAELSYVVGDLARAAKYIGLAMDNATEFNSKYRIIESSKSYPIITMQLRSEIEHDRTRAYLLSIVILLALLLLALSTLYIIKQRRKVYAQAQELSLRNRQLEAKNKEIEEANRNLKDNRGVTSLLVGKMMSGIATRRELIDQMKKELSVKIKVKQYDSLGIIVEKYTKDIASTYLNVDEVLLAFFPNFAKQFNALLREDCRFEVKPGCLPIEMRIFALWRIGVRKNESIANCLQYSLNTVKSYKTRVLNASLYGKEEFYDRLMQIAIDITE